MESAARDLAAADRGQLFARPDGRLLCGRLEGSRRGSEGVRQAFLNPHAVQYGMASLKVIFSSPAFAIIFRICSFVNLCSRRVPNRSNASVRSVYMLALR